MRTRDKSSSNKKTITTTKISTIVMTMGLYSCASLLLLWLATTAEAQPQGLLRARQLSGGALRASLHHAAPEEIDTIHNDDDDDSISDSLPTQQYDVDSTVVPVAAASVLVETQYPAPSSVGKDPYAVTADSSIPPFVDADEPATVITTVHDVDDETAVWDTILASGSASHDVSFSMPTRSPVRVTPGPTQGPTKAPTTTRPTKAPTTKRPTRKPTMAPTTKRPTRRPTKSPTTKRPTRQPTKSPTKAPTKSPTISPTFRPSPAPRLPEPTLRPTPKRTRRPSQAPQTAAPSQQAPATVAPTLSPTLVPMQLPTTVEPTSRPTIRPTQRPSTLEPALGPTIPPTQTPQTLAPTSRPTTRPTPATAQQTLWDLIQAFENLNTLEAAVIAAGLENVLETRNPLTVFAPTDQAFELFGSEYTNLLISDPSFGLHLRNLLTNHVTDTSAYSLSNLTDGLSLNMLGNEPVTVQVNATGTFLETFAASTGLATGVQVLPREQVATNGILQQVPQVLAPLWFYLNLVGVMEAIPNRYRTLLNLIEMAGIEGLIVSDFATLIAPTNAAFNALPDRTFEYLINNPDALREVLEYHFINSVIDFSNFPLGDTSFTTFQGDPLIMSRRERAPSGTIDLFFNDARSSIFYLTKFNILYEVDEVLLPPGFTVPPTGPTTAPTTSPSPATTLFGLVSTTPRFTGIATLIDSAGVTAALNDPARGPFTLFAPGNNALVNSVGQTYFNKLNTPGYDLHATSLTQYHIATNELTSNELTDGLSIAMANGLTLVVNVTGNDVQLITSAASLNQQAPVNVIAVDSSASNGVLHQVDAALLPFWFFFNPKEALDALPETFSQLSSLFTAAQINRELAMLVDSTLLAPNNNALASVPQATLDFLLDPDNDMILEEVLLYHAIIGLIPFTQLDFGTFQYSTVQGEPVTVTVTRSGTGGKLLRFNQARGAGAGFYLTKEDIIYQIDALLIPPSLVDVIPASTAVTPSAQEMVALYGGAKSLNHPSGSSMVSQAGLIPVAYKGATPKYPSQ